MNLRLTIGFILAAAWGAAGAPAAEPKLAAPSAAPTKMPATPARTASAVAPSVAFDAFRLVADRNIFNPNRTGRRDGAAEQPPRVETLSLVGTMDSEKGVRAFFDGSEPGFRKALRPGESVDKFKVTRITPNAVDLERDGKPLTMRVGQHLRRPAGEDWALVGEEAARREAEARAAAAAQVDPTAAPAIPANVDALTRKLMERRQKELKQ